MSAGRGWRCALALVGAAHLTTTAGSWIVTDLGEALFVARRLLTHGSFVLSEQGDPVAELPWLISRPGEPTRSRLYPVTPLTLAPLLALDRLAGWDSPRPDGRLVHLQGHIAVLAGLALLGWSVARLGRSARAAALSVAVTGFAWPVWQVSRRAGPEAVLILLVCLFLAGWTLRETGSSRAGWTAQAAGLVVLPWTHATGSLLGAALVGAAAIEIDRATRPADRLRRALPLALALACGVVTVAAWNQLVHGDWWRGGYAPYLDVRPYLGGMSAWRGAWIHAAALAPQLALLVAPGLLVAFRRRSLGGGAATALLATGLLIAFFASFDRPEPARRLACVCPLWGFLLGRRWDELGWGAPAARVSLAAAGLLGFYWFMRVDGRYFVGPGGLYYPHVLWVELALAGRPLWQVAAPVVTLLGGGWLAARCTARALGGSSHQRSPSSQA